MSKPNMPINCKECGAEFMIFPSEIKRNRKYCNRKCYMASGDHAKTLEKANSMTPRNYWAGKKRPEMTGALNPRWTGNTTDDYRERRRFRSSMQKKVFTRDDYTCQVCHQRGGSLQVDHIKGWKENPDLRFDIDNCRTLCMACHYYVTFKKKIPDGIVWGHGFNRRVAS